MTYFATPPQSICILRLSAIGDVCNAVSMVQAVQHHWPQCQLTWVVGRLEAGLLAGLPGVELVVFDKRLGLSAYRQLRQALAGRKFDVLLHMQSALRASAASLCIRARYKVGFDRQQAREAQWLFTNRRIQPLTQPHVLEGFRQFARCLGVPDYQPMWQMPIPQAAHDWACEHLGTGRYLAICPAASKSERNWTVDGYARVAEHAQQKGLNVVLCGGPGEQERALADAIMQQARVPVLDLVGKTSLKQLLAVLKQVCVVLAPDTGPAHMAVSVSTPVLGLYAHSNPRRTGPYLFRHYVVNHYDKNAEAQHGKPWQQLPWGTRVKGDELMQKITSQEVSAMLDRILEREVQVGDHCGSSCHRPLEHDS